MDDPSAVHPARRSRSPDVAVASPDWAKGDPAELRRAYRGLRPGRLRPGDRWCLLGAAPAVPALVHTPRRPRDPRVKVVYFHGGGWIVGSPVTHIDITHALADAAGLELLSVDYRLLPGPAAAAPVRDGLSVARRLLARDPATRLVFAGDSAGAAIALAAAQSLEDRYRGRLLGILSFYAGCGVPRSGSLSRFGRREDGLDRASLQALYRYLTTAPGPNPFTLRRLTRRRLPPTALFVGDRDPLLADSFALQVALRANGSNARIRVVPGVGHSYLHEVATSAVARSTIAEAAGIIDLWRSS